jgi:thioredoxin-dependent peroxiredoxin
VVNEGDRAPDFETTDCTGKPVKLSSFAGKRVVLFFFPRAFTPNCTIEIRHFRDNQSRIEARNAVLIGVSVDKHEKQCAFAAAEHIEFHLIGDPDRVISEKYGVVWPVLRIDRRATFIIDERGIVERVIHHELQVFKHLDDVLLALGPPRPTTTT